MRSLTDVSGICPKTDPYVTGAGSGEAKRRKGDSSATASSAALA